VVSISSDEEQDLFKIPAATSSSTSTSKTTTMTTMTTIKTEIKVEKVKTKEEEPILISSDDDDDIDASMSRSVDWSTHRCKDEKPPNRGGGIWVERITPSPPHHQLLLPSAPPPPQNSCLDDLERLIDRFVHNLEQTSAMCHAVENTQQQTEFYAKRMEKCLKETRRILTKVFSELSACNAGLRYFDPNPNPERSLSHVNRSTVKAWFTEKFPTTIPGTLRAYVSVFKKFLRYVLAEEVDDVVATTTTQRGVDASLIASQIRASVEYLQSSVGPALSKSARFRKFNLQPTERKNLLTKEDMQLYENSLHVREIVARLTSLAEMLQSTNRFDDATTTHQRINVRSMPQYGCLRPNLTFCTEARNVLLTLLLFRSAQRSGCFAGLTLGEFAAAESLPTDPGLVVISVSNHKTFDVHGHAKLVVDKWLYDLMESYARYLRPLSNNFDTLRMNEDGAPFFITRSSTPLDNGYVSQAIVASWTQADIPRDFISVTNFRKVSSSSMHRRIDCNRRIDS
jgi:hypothetical protein